MRDKTCPQTTSQTHTLNKICNCKCKLTHCCTKISPTDHKKHIENTDTAWQISPTNYIANPHSLWKILLTDHCKSILYEKSHPQSVGHRQQKHCKFTHCMPNNTRVLKNTQQILHTYSIYWKSTHCLANLTHVPHFKLPVVHSSKFSPCMYTVS